MRGNDVPFLGIKEIGARLRAKTLSAVELTQAYLARSERLDGRLHAWASLMRDRALREAQEADRELAAGRDRGPLHGIPYAAKDLLAARGAPTTWGARPYARQTFDHDATVIRKLREAGAVLLGKAAMIELAGGMGYRYPSASLTGATRNPWDPGRWTCGSSSGSGAIAGAGMAAFALGSETWGSVVCPSASCGLSGLRPTYGRVSRHGAMPLSWSMDKIGVLARSADDCGLVLAAIAGPDPADPSSLPQGSFRPARRPRSERLRLGWVANAWKKVPRAIESAARTAVRTLAGRGAAVSEVKLPAGPWDEAAWLTICAEAGSIFESLIDSGKVSELADPLGKVNAYLYRELGASDYLRAQRIREVGARRMEAIFQQVDVLAAPTLPMVAMAIDANIEKAFAFADPLGALGNLCGLPAISVPCGFDGGLPIGLVFVGPPLGDGAVLGAACLYQQHSDWHRRRPRL